MAVKTFGAITIGSTETELKIYEFTARRGMREIECLNTHLDLGIEAYTMKRISTARIEEICQVLKEFKQVLSGYHVEACRVCATSAFRESRNIVSLLDYIGRQTGLEIEVLSNSEQRFLDYKSIASVTAEFETIIQNATAIVDLGGHSMQISLFDKDKLITTQNVQIGTISTREKLASYIKNRTHFVCMAGELMDHELAGFNKLYRKDRKIRNLIVVGGNIEHLLKNKKTGAIASLEKADFLQLYDRVAVMSPEEIASTYELSPDLIPPIVSAVIYCHYLVENFEAETIWLPGFTLCDGLAYDFGDQKHLIPVQHKFDEDIIAAARSISKRYKCSQSHIRILETLGLEVFDKMKKQHGLNDRDRLLLQIAIILHNCGKFISLENVSDCAYNIIMATEIIGLSHLERQMIADIVKFNNSEFPDYEEFEIDADQSTDIYMRIAKLTAILRLVNSLDRTHRQKCEQVTVTLKDNTLKFLAATQEDISLEQCAFRAKAAFFEEVFHVSPELKQKKHIR